MATHNATNRLSLQEVRPFVKRLQSEGERFVGRVREDVVKLAKRAPQPELPAVVVDARKRASFAAAVRRYLPALDEAALTPDFAGVRAKLAGPGESFRDFCLALIQVVDGNEAALVQQLDQRI